MAERFEQDMRALEQGAEQAESVSRETQQPRPDPDDSILGAPVAMHNEATMLAFTALNDPHGVRWNLTIRHGARAQDVIDFSDMIARAGQGMIALGWEPVDPKSAVVWPPADRQEEERTKIERAAQALSVEIAQEQLLPQAKSALFNSAIALGFVKNKDDAEGIDHMISIGKDAGLTLDSLPGSFAKWVHALATRRTDEIKGEYAARAQSHASPPIPPPPASTRTAAYPSTTTPPPSRAAPPPPPASAASAPPPPHGSYSGNAAPPAGEQTMRIAKLKIGTTQDGSPKLEFYGQGHRYKDLDWAMGAQAFLDHFPAVVAAGWTVAHLEAIGQEYPFEATMGYTLSEKTNTRGNPYKDITSIAMG